MRSDFKVIIHPCDLNGASALYRLIWPAEQLQKEGYDVEIRHGIPYRVQRITNIFWDPIVGIEGEVDGDVIVFQRPLSRELYELMGTLQDMGKAVVVELDDAFHALPPHNPVRKDCDPITHPNSNWNWLEKACARADWMTCTTQALADHYAPHGRVTVIPNYMPRWYTEIPRPDEGEKVSIGWTGTVSTHGGDLRVTGGSIGRVVSDVDAQLKVVGTGQGVAEALSSSEPQVCGWVAIEDYPYEMAKFDVGIVPLKLTKFTASKSWLKVVEFASFGVPVVASPTEDNMKAAALGLCELAATPEEWYEKSRAFLEDKNLRESFGLKAREYVAAHLTVENNAIKWQEAWGNAHERRTAIGISNRAESETADEPRVVRDVQFA